MHVGLLGEIGKYLGSKAKASNVRVRAQFHCHTFAIGENTIK
jgi:hypothetical protein